MEITALDAAIRHLESASQALWDARNKGDCDRLESNFLEPLQTALASMTAAATAARDFLKERHP